MTTRILYMQELEELERSLEEMGNAIEASFDKLLTAIEKKDENMDMQIICDDRYINDMERSIEAKCLSLITKQQPIAKDLRMVSAALKVVTDIERIGDQTADIAELLIRIRDCSMDLYSEHMKEMFLAVKKMLHDAVDSFIRRDCKAAEKVIEYDDVVDGFFDKVKKDLIGLLQRGTDDTDICLDILMIAKYLERIGDHASNIAEWEIFQESGVIDEVRLL